MNKNPIALIGAGPVGLEMAGALKRAGMPYRHFEAGPIGATMAWWAHGTRWFSSNERISIAGIPLVTPAQEKATREEYLAYLCGIVQQCGLEVQTFRQIVGISRGPAETDFTLTVRHALFENALPEMLGAGKIILATGGTAAPNLLGVPGEELPHVSHYFGDPHLYFGKRVLVVGGRNSAVEAALRCHRAGAKVLFCYRGAAVDGKDIKYWLYPEFASLLKSGKVEGFFNTHLLHFNHTSVILRRGEETLEVPVDFVLAMTGYRADMGLAKMAGVHLLGEQEMPEFNAKTMETNVPGVYVIGTAVAGSQRRYKIFLENCHVHVPRVLAHLRGEEPPTESLPVAREAPET